MCGASCREMGISEPNVAYRKALDKEFTFYVVYGTCVHGVDYTSIKVAAVEQETMTMEQTDAFIREI